MATRQAFPLKSTGLQRAVDVMEQNRGLAGQQR